MSRPANVHDLSGPRCWACAGAIGAGFGDWRMRSFLVWMPKRPALNELRQVRARAPVHEDCWPMTFYVTCPKKENPR